MAGWKSSWNNLAMRLMLSFAAFVVVVTAVFSISPYIFVKGTLEDELAERGEAWLETLQDPVAAYRPWT